ncbi:MAG: squalene/phytoene synthase family protein [Candidatus Altiarchaeota archaeon]|nr:squalene/phytoene synthase family protein [Candidatus Altiarchaeota archaeon]
MASTNTIQIYPEVEDLAWDSVVDDCLNKNSVKIIDRFFDNEKDALKLKTSYTFLRFIDEGVDLIRKELGSSNEGTDPREKFIDYVQDLTHENNEVSLKYEGKNISLDELWGELEEEKISSDGVLRILVESKNTALLAEAFKKDYGAPSQEIFGRNYFQEFMDGMRLDLNTEGDTFSKVSLDDYFNKVQTLPLLMGFKSLGVDYNNLPDGFSFDDIYTAADGIGKGLLTMKSVRGKEMTEDARMNRIYMPQEDLEGENFSRDDFLLTVYGKGDQNQVDKLQRIVEGRVKRAHEQLYRGIELLQKLPSTGIFGGIKKSMAAYALIAKGWAKNLESHQYNPLDPNSSTGYRDIEMGDTDKLKVGVQLKLLGKSDWLDKRLYSKILDWNFLDKSVQYSMTESGFAASS